MSKKRKNLIAILGVLSIALITIGTTYAFFSYLRSGSTENTIKSGSITFLYDEINRSGNSIGIVDALPTSDTDGKAQTNAFNFKIQSTTATDMAIPYEITLRQKEGTDNIGDKIKVYLSKTTGYEAPVNTETEVKTSLFSTLPDTTHNGYSEKTLHTDEVPTGAVNYTQNYRLKMWLDESVDLSNEAYNGKTFTVMVNVYANGRIASSNANIESISVNNTVLTAVNANVYEATVPYDTTSTTVAVETEDDNSTVTITKTESDYTTPISLNENIQRLSKTHNQTVSLTNGHNYFKIVVNSENNKNNSEIHLKITVPFILSNQIKLDNTLRTETPDFTTSYPNIILSYTDNNFNGTTSNWTMSSTYQAYYYTYADSYTFDTTTGTYTLVNPQVCQYSSCYETLKNKYVVSILGSTSTTAATSNNLSSIYKLTSDTTLDKLYYIYSTRTINYDYSLSGLYKMSVTDGFGGTNGETYYFRGQVENNKVKFANLDWRIIRINEDGTVRLILDGMADESNHKFNSNYNDFSYMYYSNSQAKTDVETWYNANITGSNATKVATGNYFCETAKVKYNSKYTSGSATMTVYNEYTPDLKCQTDGNSKGLVNNSVGLINYDEVVLAGGYWGKSNNSYYLYKNYDWWTMSPASFGSDAAYAWSVLNVGYLHSNYVGNAYHRLRPVINLKADTLATYNSATGYYEVN